MQTHDLILTFAPPADDSSDLATWTLQFNEQTASGTLPPLISLISPEQRSELRWYLEEYIEWPFMEFRDRGDDIVAELAALGKRLFATVFESSVATNKMYSDWDRHPHESRTLKIVSELPAVLSVPWELLHDEQGFLALRRRYPVAILRTISRIQPSREPVSFVLPLRVLMVVARPDDAGFLDPRSSARTVLQALDDLVEQDKLKPGTIEVEFLRPPTLKQLSRRLQDAERPIHILHFDGHGTFSESEPAQSTSHPQFKKPTAPQGGLAFEDDQQALDLVKADKLAQMLNDSGVRVVLLDACQTSRMSDQATTTADQQREQVLGSVATRLLTVGVDAVVAMSASVLIKATAIFFGELYAQIASGTSVPAAIERARQALQADPVRFLYPVRNDEAPEPVDLVDWWLPHFYQQRAVTLLPSGDPQNPRPITTRGFAEIAQRQFVGRARELLQIERALLKGKLVVLHGFGGVGKTRLASEAAAWLTRTGMYRGALFCPFEHGGDATFLLSEVARFYGVTETASHDLAAAMKKLKPKIRKEPLLIIADNLESLLPVQDAEQPITVLEAGERQALWDALLALSAAGAGVVLTTRDTAFGDGRLAQGQSSDVLRLRGLQPADAYTLATKIIADLKVSRQRAPYVDLRDLLTKLDYHPLAMSLTLLALRDETLALSDILRDYTALLPTFTDDTTHGRNAALLASLDYSLRRLTTEQRAWLLRLAPFEGGVSEDDLLAITEIPEAVWRELRPALEHAALLTVEPIEGVRMPFLRFHPILAPYLRTLPNAEPAALLARFAAHYAGLANYLYHEDSKNPIPVRALVRRELPNLQRAFDLLIALGESETAVQMANGLNYFYNKFSMRRERASINERIKHLSFNDDSDDGSLSYAEYLRESSAGEAELSNGNLNAAFDRFNRLLERILANPTAAHVARGSYAHCLTLGHLAECLRTYGHPAQAEALLREALSIIESLITAQPEKQGNVRQRSTLLTDLGDVLLNQGKFAAARTAYESSLEIDRQTGDERGQAVLLGQLGTLAFQQREYQQAQQRYEQALVLFSSLNEPANIAGSHHQLGMVAAAQRNWSGAEKYYRQSLALCEQYNLLADAARTCNQLAIVAKNSGRPAEAEQWYRRAIQIDTSLGNPRELASDLNNLANLLMNEVQAKRQPHSRLAEARLLAEQALTIREQLDTSAEIWSTLNILAQIAEMEGRSAEVQGYRRRERIAFAAFEGNRWHIDNDFGELITASAAAARGNEAARAAVEQVFPQMEAGNLGNLPPVIRRIWAGERDWHSLCEGIARNLALVVLRVLEEIEGQGVRESDDPDAPNPPIDPDQLIAALPADFRAAVEQQDNEAVQAAFAALPAAEQQRVREILAALQGMQ